MAHNRKQLCRAHPEHNLHRHGAWHACKPARRTLHQNIFRQWWHYRRCDLGTCLPPLSLLASSTSRPKLSQYTFWVSHKQTNHLSNHLQILFFDMHIAVCRTNAHKHTHTHERARAHTHIYTTPHTFFDSTVRINPSQNKRKILRFTGKWANGIRSLLHPSG